MKNHRRIAVLLLYFGKLPWYTRHFINSCGYNPTIDFFLIIDQPFKSVLPGNVAIVQSSFQAINRALQEKLGFETRIYDCYKLCDLKPLYGFLFQDLLKSYDFWGQCDLDVIFGNIRYFMDDYTLDRYDYISVRHDIPSGCFSLFRNTDVINNLFLRSKDIRKVLANSKHFCFDECNFAHNQIALGKSIFECKCEIESFMHLIKAAEQEIGVRAHFDLLMLDGLVGKIKFSEGELIYRNEFEAILYHLIDLKRIYNPSTASRTLKTFAISPTRIYRQSPPHKSISKVVHTKDFRQTVL